MLQIQNEGDVMVELVNSIRTDVLEKYGPGRVIEGHEVHHLEPFHVHADIWMIEAVCLDGYRFYLPEEGNDALLYLRKDVI